MKIAQPKRDFSYKELVFENETDMSELLLKSSSSDEHGIIFELSLQDFVKAQQENAVIRSQQEANKVGSQPEQDKPTPDFIKVEDATAAAMNKMEEKSPQD